MLRKIREKSDCSSIIATINKRKKMEEKTKKVWSMGKILLGKLELNMYLDIRFCVKWLPFSFFLNLLGNSHIGDALWKWVFSGDLWNSQGSSCAGVYFLIKLLVSGLRLCWRGGSAAVVYSCGYYEIFGSVFFKEHLLDGCFCLFYLW